MRPQPRSNDTAGERAPQPKRDDPRPYCMVCAVVAADVLVANGRGGAIYLCTRCYRRRKPAKP
jgi:hypothetical protein